MYPPLARQRQLLLALRRQSAHTVYVIPGGPAIITDYAAALIPQAAAGELQKDGFQRNLGRVADFRL